MNDNNNKAATPEVKRRSKANKDIITTTEKGSVNINEAVIISIAKNAASQIPGVIRLTTNGKFAESFAFMLGRAQSKPDSVQIITLEDKLTVSVKIVVSYGKNIPELAQEIQLAIIHSIKEMAQIEVSSVDVIIEGIEEEEKIDGTTDLMESIV